MSNPERDTRQTIVDTAERFFRDFDGSQGGLIRGALLPDRIQTCTPALLQRTAALSRELAAPVRLHCCQGPGEVALVKVTGSGEMRAETLRLADAFHAKVVDATREHFIFEITGKSSKVDQFVAIMKPLGLSEVCRTGIAAMNRGPQGM